MIIVDWKVARAALKLTKSYKDEIFYASGGVSLMLVAPSGPPVKSAVVSASPEDIPPAITRLAEKNFFKIIIKTEDEVYFSIQPELRHWFAFWFDRVSKRYIAGFISGVITTVVSGLIVHYLTGLF